MQPKYFKMSVFSICAGECIVSIVTHFTLLEIETCINFPENSVLRTPNVVFNFLRGLAYHVILEVVPWVVG